MQFLLAQVNDDPDYKFSNSPSPNKHTYKYRKTEKKKQEEKSQKIRNASLAKFYLHIFTFLSLNYFSGVPLGSRKSRGVTQLFAMRKPHFRQNRG